MQLYLENLGHNDKAKFNEWPHVCKCWRWLLQCECKRFQQQSIGNKYFSLYASLARWEFCRFCYHSMFTLKRNPTKKPYDGLNKRATTEFEHLGKQCVWCCNASPNYTTLISSVESTVGKAVEWFFVTRSLEGDGRLPLLAPHSPPSHAALPMTAKLRCF